MRNSIRLASLAALAAASFSTAAHAADTATASATAEVLSTIAVAKDADLSFGTIAVNGDGTYVLGADGNYVCSAALICTGARNPAAFTVTGTAANVGVAAGVDQASIVLTHATDNTKTFTVDNFSIYFPAGNSLVSGTTSFAVGGTLNVIAANALQGTYTGQFDVTVEYQ